MIKYRIYKLYPGFDNSDRLVIPEFSVNEFDTIEDAAEMIFLHGAGKGEYTIIPIVRFDS